MQFDDWIRRSVLTRIALMLPLSLLTLLPLVKLARSFFQLPLTIIILASAALLTWIIWKQQPRAVLGGERLLLEAYETLPEAGVLYNAVSTDALRLVQKRMPSILPAGSILLLTLITLAGWYALLFTLGMTWHDLLVNLGMAFPEDQLRTHTLRRMDIPARMPAAVTGSMDTSRIRSTPLSLRRQDTPPSLPESFWLTIGTGGQEARPGGQQTPLGHPEQAVRSAEPLITHIPPTDPLVTAYYRLLLQPD